MPYTLYVIVLSVLIVLLKVWNASDGTVFPKLVCDSSGAVRSVLWGFQDKVSNVWFFCADYFGAHSQKAVSDGALMSSIKKITYLL